jgi:BppU N-terminal domain
MSKPANYPLNVRIGDTETVTVTMQDNNGNPINITGRTYSAQIRSKTTSTTPLATFSCSIVNAAQGIFACTLSATSSASLTAANAVWDLQETNGVVITTLLAGEAVIDGDVTR